MIKLNKAQLVVCWMVVLLISFLILAPAIKVEKFYQYKSKDGWEWKRHYDRKGEYIDESGNPYKVEKSETIGKNIFNDILPDKPIRRYYYAGSYNEYSLDKGDRRNPIHPYERFALVVVLNGLLLIYSLGMIKPAKTNG